MGRPKVFKDDMEVVSTRIHRTIYRQIQDIAALESFTRQEKVSAQDLIRDALLFVYGDNERMRESFRRTRERNAKKFR